MLPIVQRSCRPTCWAPQPSACGVPGTSGTASKPHALAPTYNQSDTLLVQLSGHLRWSGNDRRHTAVVAALATAGRIAPSQERRQHVARDEAAERRRKSVNVAKLLTNHIVATNSLEQLHDILAMHANSLDHIHVAALLSRTAHISLSLEQQSHQQSALSNNSLQQAQQQDQQQSILYQQQLERQQLLVRRLTEMMAQRLRHAKSHTLVAAVAALGRLSTIHSVKGPSTQQLQQIAAKAQGLLPTLDLSQLSVIIWGLAKAGYRPHSSWLEPVLAAFMQQYSKAAAQQEHERQAQQAVQQQQQEDPRLQRPVLPNTIKQQQDHVLRPNQHTLATDLSLVMYSLAVMGKQPDAGWLAEWQAAMLQQLSAANMQDLSQSLWASANLGVNLEPSWLEAVLSAAEPLLPRYVQIVQCKLQCVEVQYDG